MNKPASDCHSNFKWHQNQTKWPINCVIQSCHSVGCRASSNFFDPKIPTPDNNGTQSLKFWLPAVLSPCSSLTSLRPLDRGERWCLGVNSAEHHNSSWREVYRMKSNWVKRKKIASSVWVNWIRRFCKVQVFDSCAVCVSEQGTKTQGPSSWCPQGTHRDWMTINWTRYRMCRIWPQRKDWNRHCRPASPGWGAGRGARKERANVNGWTVAILIIVKNESVCVCGGKKPRGSVRGSLSGDVWCNTDGANALRAKNSIRTSGLIKKKKERSDTSCRPVFNLDSEQPLMGPRIKHTPKMLLLVQVFCCLVVLLQWQVTESRTTRYWATGWLAWLLINNYSTCVSGWVFSSLLSLHILKRMMEHQKNTKILGKQNI